MRAAPETIVAARRLRRTLSLPEAMLWVRLRARRADSQAFRRQHPIGPYVLDFYCVKAGLAVEIDGLSHDAGARPRRDARRDAWLKAQGLTVMRIPATDVLRSADDVADGLMQMAKTMAEERRPPPPR